MTTGSPFSGTGTASGGDITAQTLGITAWTSTDTVYVDFDVSLTTTSALAASNKYGSMTCAKFATAEYVCAYLEVAGSGAITGTWTWSIYGKATAPATADFTTN